MNTLMMRWTSLLALVLALGGIAQAQSRTDKRAQVLAQYDKNQNGRLDPAERQTWIAAEREAVRKKYDRNRDGKLDAAERKAMAQGRANELFQAFDNNRDGRITKSEVAQHSPFEYPMFHDRFAGFDGNGDGAVTNAEIQKTIERAAQRYKSSGN